MNLGNNHRQIIIKLLSASLRGSHWRDWKRKMRVESELGTEPGSKTIFEQILEIEFEPISEPGPDSTPAEVKPRPTKIVPLFFQMGLNPTQVHLTPEERLGFCPSPKSWATDEATQSRFDLRTSRRTFQKLGLSSFNVLLFLPP
jgi:hypothetical protein